MEPIRVIAIGDIYGKPGRKFLRERLPSVVKKYHPHLIIANGENSAGGRGINSKTYKEIKEAGVHIITTGNHVFDDRGYTEVIDKPDVVVFPLVPVIPMTFSFFDGSPKNLEEISERAILVFSTGMNRAFSLNWGGGE